MRWLILIKGGGDIATAVAVRLYQAGHRVLVAEAPGAPILRRAMSFGAAIDQGEVVVEGIRSRPAETVPETMRLLAQQIVPVWTGGWKGALDALRPEVLVDARMMKRERNAETRRDQAPLVIGLGPGFIAGKDVHLVIETNHGANLGRIISDGEAEPHTGVARLVEGYGNERYTYAPSDGTFVTLKGIGGKVEADELLGHVGAVELRSRFAGIVRGILRSGTEVQRGQRLVDVYPGGDETVTRTFTDRAGKIAEAVLRAIEMWERSKG
jgi:xanthine dehydrogenase accessory factor